MNRETTAGRGTSAVADVDGNGGVEEQESPFRHYVPGERPRADGAFFELLLHRVVTEKGDLPEFETQWPRGVQTLAGLNIFRLANMSGKEIAEAVANAGGDFSARLAPRTDSLVVWAEAFWRIRQIYGSFRQYIRSFDNDGFEALLEDLKQRLPGLSPEFLTAFLHAVGEKTPGAAVERGQQQPPRKQAPGQAPAPATRGATPERQAGAAPERRGRRRRGRGGQKPQAAAAPATQKQAKPTSTPAQQPQDKGTAASSGASGGSHRRRRFFRRRPGGRGKGTAAPSSSAT
jgi:hypothetical protein